MKINTIYRFFFQHSKFAKSLLFFGFVMIMISCKKDYPPELNCDLSHPDQICREDAYRRGQFLGYIEYSYLANNQLYQKKFYSVSHSYLEETYEYNNRNLLVYKKGINKDGDITEEQNFVYTEFDSISTLTTIKNGVTTVFTAFEYDSLNRLKIRFDFIDGVLQKSVYIYGDDGKLYSMALYDENEKVISYKIYKNYLNNVTKVFEYNNKEVLLGINVIVKDKDDNILEIRKFDADNILRHQETFTYYNNKLSKHSWLTGNYEIEFRLFHYP